MRRHAKTSFVTHDAVGAIARFFATLVALFPVIAGCTARQETGASTPIAGERKAQAIPDPAKFKAAAEEWENWIKHSDPESGKTKFRYDLRKTDSLLSPYVATFGYWLFDDVEIDYVFSFQEGEWVFTKGTWTAHHSGGRVAVTSHNGGAERAKLETLLQ